MEAQVTRLEKRTVRASRLRYRPSYLTAWDTSGFCNGFRIICRSLPRLAFP